MKTVIFRVNDQLSDKLDALMEDSGFTNQSEFLRFLIVNYWENKNKDAGFNK